MKMMMMMKMTKMMNACESLHVVVEKVE